MAYLLDTHVLSELRKGPRAAPRVRAWALDHVHERHCISILALGEIRRGIEPLRRRAPAACTALEQWLDRLKSDYAENLLPIDAEIADQWGRLNARRTLPVIDGLLAATALVHDLTVVTRNTKDFAGTGVRVVDPFR
jgi:predicted nucleic acid-binding protein